MPRVLYKDLKTELARIAGATGFAATDSRFLTRFNKATQEIMNEGDFPGVVDRYAFIAYDGYITLPGDLDRIMGIATNGTPIELRSPWYEFVQDGPGPQGDYSGMELGLDRGEVATFRDIPTGVPSTIRVYGTVDERISGDRPIITLRGYDSDGEWVRTQDGDGNWIDGLEVEIDGDSVLKYIETGILWSKIESVIKPETRGTVQLWAYDGTDELHLANYAPRETRPSYRRYFFPHLQAERAHPVLLRARKRYLPVAGDNDWVIITNLPAMECMLTALQKREAGEMGEYMQAKALAVDILNKEAIAYHGKAIKPALTFTRGFSIGAFPHVV
jgi:hypothetical protein